MDTTTLSVAGPGIARSLNGSLAEIQWLVNAFLLAFAVLLVANGSLAARFGEVTLLRRGTVVFAAGSLLACAAPSMSVLLGCRVIQGAGAAAMLPSAIATFRAQFGDERKAVAMAAYFGASAGGAAIGPILAGGLLTFAPWRTVFAFSAVVALGILVGLTRVRASEQHELPPEPLVAVNVVLGAGLLALVWGLIRAGSAGWSDAAVLATLAAGGAILGGLAVHGVRRRASLAREGIQLDALGVLIVAQVAAGGPAIGTVFLLSGLLQRVRGQSAVEVGLLILPFLATASVLSPVAGRLRPHVAARTQLAAGFAVQTVALLWLAAVVGDDQLLLLCPPLVLTGVATALIVPTLLNGFMEAAPPAHGALMGGVNVSANQVGNLIGVALLGSIFAEALAPELRSAVADAGTALAPAMASGYAEATAQAIRVGAAFSAACVPLALAFAGRVVPAALPVAVPAVAPLPEQAGP
jgi:MFS family permease